jgi:fatty-acyl-CoA synthase
MAFERRRRIGEHGRDRVARTKPRFVSAEASFFERVLEVAVVAAEASMGDRQAFRKHLRGPLEQCQRRHCGAVLNTLNTRLDAAAVAFMLDHGEAKGLMARKRPPNSVQKLQTAAP